MNQQVNNNCDLPLRGDDVRTTIPTLAGMECQQPLRGASRTIGFLRRGYSRTGGAEAYLRRLAKGLLERGYRVVLIGTGEWPADAWPGGEVVVLQARSLKAFAREVLEYKKTGAIHLDLLFSLERVPGCDIFRAGDGVHAAWLEHRKKREPCWKRWFSSWMPQHREVLALERVLFHRDASTHVIANSAMVAHEIEAYFQFPSERLSIIANGVPHFQTFTSKERQAARDSFGISQRDFVVLFVGSGWKRKGVGVAVEAIEQITQQQKVPHVCLWVAGKGPARKYHSEAVSFLGPVKKIELLYAAADLFILPTLYDPFANACLEALAAGLPVITTSSNGCAEVIEEGIHGSVIDDPNDVDAFAAAILVWRERLQSKEESAIRAACRERGALFDMEKNLKETVAVIEQVLAESLPSVPPL